MKVSELGLAEPQVVRKIIKINDTTELKVRTYLPIVDKGNLISFVAANAIDNSTGCFSPLRIEVYFAIALCRYYADIEFTEDDMKQVDKVYDLLENSQIIDKIESVIPSEELEFIQDLVNDTLEDIARYNGSAMGIIQAMSSDTTGLDDQLREILNSIQANSNELEFVKDVVKNG